MNVIPLYNLQLKQKLYFKQLELKNKKKLIIRVKYLNKIT